MINIYLEDVRAYTDRQQYEEAFASLSPARQKKCSTFRYPKDRCLSLAAGIALDRALRSIGSREKDAVYAYGSNGKPTFLNLPEYHFNLSHSGNYAVCAFADCEVGIDLEEIRQADEALIAYVCTSHEREDLASLRSNEKNRQFTRIWTMKESYVKFLGLGLSISPKDLDTVFDPTLRIRRTGVLQPVHFAEQQFENHHMVLCVDRSFQRDDVYWQI